MSIFHGGPVVRGKITQETQGGVDMMKPLNLTAGILMAAACVASAHLVAGSLKPAGTETLKSGDSFTITWTEQFNHGGTTDIHFSKDGGKSWAVVKTGFKDAA